MRFLESLVDQFCRTQVDDELVRTLNQPILDKKPMFTELIFCSSHAHAVDENLSVAVHVAKDEMDSVRGFEEGRGGDELSSKGPIAVLDPTAPHVALPRHWIIDKPMFGK